MYLHSRAVREERREERALLPHALGSYISESRLQYILLIICVMLSDVKLQYLT